MAADAIKSAAAIPTSRPRVARPTARKWAVFDARTCVEPELKKGRSFSPALIESCSGSFLLCGLRQDGGRNRIAFFQRSNFHGPRAKRFIVFGCVSSRKLIE
jgi:hypothetical protein